MMIQSLTHAGDGSNLSPAEQIIQRERPLVIGHRGYPSIAPENTLPSFELALTAGVDLVELDYHHTRDGVPLVVHDYTLDRTTDADEKWKKTKIRVDAESAADLVGLDAGSWFHPRFAGTRLPTLVEALDVIQAKGVTLIERKAGDAKTCVELLRAKNLINQVVVQSFDWEYLRDFHRIEPRQVLGALGPLSTVDGRKLTDAEKVLNREWVDQVKSIGARAVVWNRQITREAVAYAHQADLKVWVYTINDPTLAGEILDQGVDGIITDNAAVIWKAMALRAAKAR